VRTGGHTPARRVIQTGSAWLALLCVDVLGLLPWGRIRFPLSDFAEMVYEIRRLQLGFVPYRDTVTHHFLGYLVPFFAAGSVVELTPLVLKIATVCFNFITAVFVWLALRELGQPRMAWLGAFLAVTLGWFWSWQGFGLNVQSLLAPLIAALLFLVIRACARSSAVSLCLAALSAGVLLTWDPRSLVFLPLLAIPVWFVPALRRWPIVSTATALLLIAPACATWYLVQAGAWRDFVEQTLIYPVHYRNHGVRFDAAALLSTGLGTWLGGERFAVPLMLAGLVAVLRSESRSWLRALCVISVTSAAVYAMVGGRPYPNYFMVFAPITLVLISLLPAYAGASLASLGRATTAALICLGLFCGLRPILLWTETGSMFLAPNETTIEAAADYLRANTSSADKVLVWGYAPGIYVLSDRFHTFRDEGLLSVAGANFASSSGQDQGLVPHMVREFEDFLMQDPPKAIVVYNVTREPCPGKGIIQRNFDYERNAALARLRDAIASSYQSGLIAEGSCDRAEVFVLRR
jgi:hypothetical protein